MAEKNDSYYIEKVLGGETGAFAVLVDRYKTLAYNISLGIVKLPEDAEEITQDSFLKAYRSLRSFKGDSKFSTWLYRIVYNSSITHLRKKRREVPADAESHKMPRHADQPDDDSSRQDELLASALRKAIDQLPAIERTMINLHYYDNSSIEEIARITNLSLSNVKVRLFRARKKLHDHIRSIMNNGILVN
jgi:RNA polymerase sigma factor (sigma-70 family)